MHVGGLYCCSGGGYSGRYLNGTLDELRVWTRALSSKEINDKMGVPLLAGDEEGLLFYFPLDEAVRPTLLAHLCAASHWPLSQRSVCCGAARACAGHGDGCERGGVARSPVVRDARQRGGRRPTDVDRL